MRYRGLVEKRVHPFALFALSSLFPMRRKPMA